MVLPARRPSAEMRSIHRELERRRPKSLAPKRPPAKKHPAPRPSSIGGAGDKVRRTSALLPCKNPSSMTCKPSNSAGTVDIEPLHPAPPCASSAMPPPPPSPCRSAASSVVSASEAIPVAAVRLKPGTSVRVRTSTTVKLAAKSVEIWLWLPAIVVSAAADGSYEIVYKGKLPPRDPFATVHVSSDHVVPEKQQTPPTPSPSRAASLSTAVSNTQVAASKNSSMQTQARPTTGGKSMRLVQKLVPETQPTPRPTTAGKSIHVVRKILSEMESVSADGSSLPSRDSFARDQATTQKPSPLTPPQPRAASSCPSAASKTWKIQSAPRPTTAGKSLRLLPKLVSEMQAAPRPTIAGKCIRAIPKIMSSMEFQAQPQAMLPGY